MHKLIDSVGGYGVPVFIICESALIGRLLIHACEQAHVEVAHTGTYIDELPAIEGPAVALYHVADPSLDIAGDIRRLHQLGPKIRVLALCPYASMERVRAELGDSVDAIVSDKLEPEELILSVRLLEGGYRITPIDIDPSETAEPVTVPHQRHRERPSGADLFTERELAILQRVREGMANKSIARDLGISEGTVKVHLRAIFRKMGVSNRTEAAIWSTTNS